MSKAEKTKQFILETVAPVFNKHGYSGTSMADLTKATGLTKGAIYGNFKDKEELAVQAFNYNIRRVMGLITLKVEEHTSRVMQLKTITASYRDYYEFTLSFGGCPIVNVGVDANHQNPLLLARVKEVILKLKNNIARIIHEGIDLGEFRGEIDADVYAGRIFSAIEGSIFLSVTMQDGRYIVDMMDHIDDMIDNEMIA